MPSRTGFTDKERALASKLRQLLREPGLVHGSLVEMRRRCGKTSCACATDPGRRHRSLYLAVRLRRQRRMLYIPPAWEARVRGWTAHYAEIRDVLEELSRQSVQRLEQRAD
jgi:hypothetical protein